MYPPFDLNYYMSCNEYSQDEMQPATDNMIIRQWTGLKDKNNIEIYDGDIIKEEHCISFVAFYNASFMLKQSSGYYIMQNTQYYEIIGNIYQNKDLII